ncbi:MAG: Rrf2 family transcriptional regulator [Calditrichaeota bacterium]|nr:Rrf2 family transcriptional regulator [Calditrichota bacterium]
MRFSKTTEYAIRAMVFLANHNEERFSVNRLHKKLDIPYKYLGRLMRKLASAGFVNVLQGKNGGYQIADNYLNIYLYKIVEIVEGLDDYNRCILGFPECSDGNPCSMHKFWKKHREEIKKMLYTTSLADLSQVSEIKF